MAQGVPLGSIPLEQLRQIREELERETEVLQENVRALRGAQERLLASKLNAESFGNEEAGTNAMVPLTASLYVPGKIVNPSKVLVDLGTGYYAEKSPDEASEYFLRRMATVKESIDKASGILSSKKQSLDAVSSVCARKEQEDVAGSSKEG